MTAYPEKYPYFIVPAIEALASGNLDEETAEATRRLVAANIGDVAVLRLITGIDPEEFAAFYPDLSPSQLSTTDTIDTFLDKFGNPSAPAPRAAAEIPDETVMEADTEPSDTTFSAIDSFLAAVPSPALPPEIAKMEQAPVSTPQKEEKQPENTPISEAFARECIKNHDYQRALEIIQRLSLVNPEKSVYFADQIRFLKKLIINEARKNNQKR